MFHRNDRKTEDERLDRVGRAFVRASSLEDEEVEKIASSPFLATRLRARIEAARAAKEESGDWLAIFGVAWRAVPAMGLAAALALGVLLFAGGESSAALGVGYAFSEESLLAASDTDGEGVILDEANALSREEVFSTLFEEEERRPQP